MLRAGESNFPNSRTLGRNFLLLLTGCCVVLSHEFDVSTSPGKMPEEVSESSSATWNDPKKVTVTDFKKFRRKLLPGRIGSILDRD